MAAFEANKGSTNAQLRKQYLHFFQIGWITEFSAFPIGFDTAAQPGQDGAGSDFDEFGHALGGELADACGPADGIRNLFEEAVAGVAARTDLCSLPVVSQ